MSKIREALEEVVSILSTWTDHLPPVVQDEAQEAIDKAEAALSEPLKNYEVGTVEEQYRRFELMCNNNCCNNCKSCPFSDEDGYSELEECVLKWSQMPYEKGETNEQ